MIAKEVAKYGLSFGAGVFAVLGVIGFASLVQPFSVVALDTQEPVTDRVAKEAPAQDDEISSAGSSDSRSAESGPEKKNSSAASEHAASQWLGAGTLVTGVSKIVNLVPNTMVTVEGTVTRLSDEDEFIITDSSGSIQVYTGRSLFTVDRGQRVVVSGLVDEGGKLEIYADEIVLPDGTVVEVRHWR